MSFSSFLEQLQRRFPSDSISRAEFRAFLGISITTDWRMFKRSAYPRLIRVANHDRILLSDLAKWLEQGGSSDTLALKKRGRPRGSQNKSKTTPILVDA